ncbi:type III-B CRISPR module RAMP protein Cmr1 [Haliscomenobacter sp.]|uniref:type III-B CRISPR module RAMP protein Cmr1 n=1 Tax=Haliscomenobacter sp. TaxID=2717303 RepID=UPI003593B5DE
MEVITFTCSTITPLFMAGADGSTPELRAPGIKGALRFWWRALHGHLAIDQLRDQEAKIFGSTKGRSKVLIRLEEPIDETQIINTSLLPHKGGSNGNAFAENLDFKIRVDFAENIISVEKMKNLFILACTLGGWGKRSRRGFGSVVVTAIDGTPLSNITDLQGILTHINKVIPNKFSIQGNSIKPIDLITKNYREEYPYLLEIQIGNSKTDLRAIGKATHDIMGEDEPEKTNYKYAVGAGSPRFASPIYVSMLNSHLPVITTLKSVNPKITRNDENRGARVKPEIRDNLKKEILK